MPQSKSTKSPTIYIFGDTHGVAEIEKIFLPHSHYKKGDFIIICGDFGVLWNDKIDAQESTLIRALQTLPCTILFIDGNHENFNRLAKLPKRERFGGIVGEYIKDKCYHLRRGEIYRIAGKNIFTMGGAKSVDCAYRKRNVSWWAGENITAPQVKCALRNLAHFKDKIDIVITHTCPSSFLPHIDKHLALDFRVEDSNSVWLEVLLQKIALNQSGRIEWFFGHWHSDCDFSVEIPSPCDSQILQINAHLLYNEVLRV